MRLDKRAQIFLVAPYWTTRVSIGVPPAKRPELLKKLTEALNSSDPHLQSWETELFEFPRTLRLRKHGQLTCPLVLEKQFHDDVSSFLEPFQPKANGRITYFDFGMGTIELLIDLNFLHEPSLHDFSTRCSEAKLYLVEQLNQGLPQAKFDFESIDKILTRSLESYGPTYSNKLMPAYDTAVVSKRSAMMCGPVSRNLVFFDSGSSVAQFEASEHSIRDIAACFLNEIHKTDGITQSDKIPISYEGFEGAVAVIRCADQTADGHRSDAMDASALFDVGLSTKLHAVRRTRNLWALLQIYWSAKFCASEGLYALLSEYTTNSQRPLRQLTAEYRQLEEYDRILSKIKFESQPEKITVEGEDNVAYTNVWNAYGVDKLNVSLSKIQEDVSGMLLSLRDKAEKVIQNRNSLTLRVFTALTLLSVVLDVSVQAPQFQKLIFLQKLAIIVAIAAALAVLISLMVRLPGLIKRRDG